MAAHAWDPAAEKSADEGACARRREKEPNGLGTAAEHLRAELREQGRRHAEDHGVDVDRERADEDALALQEAQSLEDRRESRLGTAAFGWQGTHGDGGAERDHERGHVDPVGGGQADVGDDDAGQGRADNHPHLPHELAQSSGGRKRLPPDQPRRHGVACLHVGAREAG